MSHMRYCCCATEACPIPESILSLASPGSFVIGIECGDYNSVQYVGVTPTSATSFGVHHELTYQGVAGSSVGNWHIWAKELGAASDSGGIDDMAFAFVAYNCECGAWAMHIDLGVSASSLLTNASNTLAMYTYAGLDPTCANIVVPPEIGSGLVPTAVYFSNEALPTPTGVTYPLLATDCDCTPFGDVGALKSLDTGVTYPSRHDDDNLGGGLCSKVCIEWIPSEDVAYKVLDCEGVDCRLTPLSGEAVVVGDAFQAPTGAVPPDPTFECWEITEVLTGTQCATLTNLCLDPIEVTTVCEDCEHCDGMVVELDPCDGGANVFYVVPADSTLVVGEFIEFDDAPNPRFEVIAVGEPGDACGTGYPVLPAYTVVEDCGTPEYNYYQLTRCGDEGMPPTTYCRRDLDVIADGSVKLILTGESELDCFNITSLHGGACDGATTDLEDYEWFEDCETCLAYNYFKVSEPAGFCADTWYRTLGPMPTVGESYYLGSDIGVTILSTGGTPPGTVYDWAPVDGPFADCAALTAAYPSATCCP